MAAWFILLLTTGATPQYGVLRDQADLIELNHFYDGDGKLLFSQLIFWEFRQVMGHRELVVRDYRLARSNGAKTHIEVKQHMPQWAVAKNFDTNLFEVTWVDGTDVRKVSAVSYRETWTQSDPEVGNRGILCKDLRNELKSTKPVCPTMPPAAENLHGDAADQTPQPDNVGVQ